MRKLIISLIFFVVCFSSNGQSMNVVLNQKDTSLCSGSSLRLYPILYIGSFRYIGTYGNSDYFVDTLARTWTDARKAAQSNGMDLWVVDDEGENNNVYNSIPNKAQSNALFWLGLYQDPKIEQDKQNPGAGWFWIDGRSLDTTFNYWATGQPDDAFGFDVGANFACIGFNSTSNRWSDVTDILSSQYYGYAIAERPKSAMTFKWSDNTTNWYIDITPTATKDYSVALTYGTTTVSTNPTHIILNNPRVTAAFTQDPSSYYCLKKNRVVFVNGSTGPGLSNATFQWDFGDGNSSSSYSVAYQYSGFSNPNPFVVTLKATDENGCVTSSTGNVTIKASPDPFSITYAQGGDVFCNGDSVYLSTGVIQRLTPAVYNWYISSSPTKLKSGSSYTAKVAGTYFLEAVIGNGCKDTAIVSVRVNPLPQTPVITVGTGYSNVFCQIDSTKLQATTPSAVNRYVWYTDANPDPIPISGSNSQIYFAKAPSGMTNSIVTVAYKVKVTDGNGCISDYSLPFSVSTKPSPTTLITAGTAPTTFCEGDSVQIFIASPDATFTHEWLKDNLSYLTGPTKIIAKTTGTYKIKETNLFACAIFSNPINVVVNKYPSLPSITPDFPVPEILPNGQINFCSNTNLTLRTTSVTGGTYQWFLDNNIMTGYTGVSAIVNKAGNYSISVKVSGCSTQSPSVKVGALPLPNGTLDAPAVNTVCDGYDLKLTAKNAVSYQWYLDGKKIIGATVDSLKAVAPGAYKVEFFTDKGCSLMSTNTINLSLIKAPSAAFSYDYYCINTPSNFTNQSTSLNSGNVDYLWQFQNGSTSTTMNAVHVFPISGTYIVKLSVIPTACPQLKNTISANIQVERPLAPETYTPINAIVGKPVGLVARSFGDFYEWKPSTGLNSQFIRLPILTPSTEQLYSVKITNRAGCVTVDSQLVRIFDEQDVYIAQGFTPNNDGINDRIYPMLVGIGTFHYIKIFNRWGNLVFQTDSTDPLKGWDGKYMGRDQPADTYTWVLEAVGINGRVIRKSGSVILIR